MGNSSLKDMLEMAKVFRMPEDRVFRYIYLPHIWGFIKKKIFRMG